MDPYQARQTVGPYLDPNYLFESNPVAKFVASPIADPGVVSSILILSHTFVKIDHKKIFSTFILLLPLNQKGLVSVTSEVCQPCPGKGVVWLTDHLDMTVAVDWDIKP